MSQPQQVFGRKRSNTAQSILRSVHASPLKVGDSRALNPWVHDVKESANVILNQLCLPGVHEGDMLRISGNNSEGVLFIVPRDEPCRQQLQISIPRPLAETFELRSNSEVLVTKVDPSACAADYVEFSFQDQYLGRNDMWRLGKSLVGQCVHNDQEVIFIGAIAAKVQSIYINGQKVSAGYITSSTKTIYRSLSAKVTIFIQVCRELWEFSGDGERYNEKIVHSFLPALFAKWREAGTNHTVTIVLISRVHYDQTETDYAAGPLRRDEDGNSYKDFYKVVTDVEVINDWKDTLINLKNSFWDFQRDILLTHHYHRGALDSSQTVRLVGRLSYAHDGPILEALNLGLNPTETHYIDRSLSHTGASTILITPGTGYFRVNKQLLRLTTTRMLDQGFGLDLISMAKPPLHQSPIFSFQGSEPELEGDKRRESDRQRALKHDPLWGGDDGPGDPKGREKTVFWWEPFWMSVSFWDKQMDLPFREDRFIATAKMHEIQMLGLLEHDVLGSIEVPYLPEDLEPTAPSRDVYPLDGKSSLTQGEKFDNDIFTLAKEFHPSNASVGRGSFPSSANSTILSSSLRAVISEKHTARTSIGKAPARIGPIEESPRPIIRALPLEDGDSSRSFLGTPGVNLSSSPSQSSMRSARTGRSASSNTSSSNQTARSRDVSVSKSTKSGSKFAVSAWLKNPFRALPSTPAEPETVPVNVLTPGSPSVSVSSLQAVAVPNPKHPLGYPTVYTPIGPSPKPKPMAIKNLPSGRSTLGRNYEEDIAASLPRGGRMLSSPINTPPRTDDFSKRRSVMSMSNATVGTLTSISSSPRTVRVNPSVPGTTAYSEKSLARRWQHIFPEVRYKSEIKWKSMITPACLPLTVEHFPTKSVLDESYDVFSYEFVLDPREARSFIVKPPPSSKSNDDKARRAWALVVLRGMAAIRLAQGFQFVLKPDDLSGPNEGGSGPRRNDSFKLSSEEDHAPKFTGAPEILQNAHDPVFLSMSNEIHRLCYTGEAIQVRRYVRRMPPTVPLQYQCLIWPKLGGGYTQLDTEFKSHGLENYGWNRLDMLVAGYEAQFHESLRYWRTRFVVVPTSESPEITTGPNGEKLNEEEIRLLGIDKLAEAFSKLRWTSPDDKGAAPPPPVRFLPTTLGPSLSVLDDSLIAQLDEIHAVGPLRKKAQSEREIEGMSLHAIAKAMREDDAVPIKTNQWHRSQYPDSWTGFDFVSWLVREFRDVSSRSQGAEWGVKLHARGLFTHCRGSHGFLDGHYFYRLNGEYTAQMTPRGGWFNRTRHSGDDPHNRFTSLSKLSPMTAASAASPRRKKTLILSQSIIMDIDPLKRSDQAETVVLHHDIIHNPATVFHFELQFIGTTARCIEDLLRQWNRTIERYGLRLVETYITQISDIRDRNPFQSCFPLGLSIPTPVVSDLENRVPLGTQTAHYFEYALLRRFGFIVDVEAGELYPETIDVVYSYRREPFKYTQFVHRSGVAFVQVLGGTQGFLFLTNRLMAPGRIGGLRSSERKPADVAEELRIRLHRFCEDRKELARFYEEELDALAPSPEEVEEPPALAI